MSRRVISFEDEERTELLTLLVQLQKEPVRLAMRQLRWADSTDEERFENEVERLCFQIRLAAQSELFGHGARRYTSPDKAIKQLQELDKVFERSIRKIKALNRPAQHLLFGEGYDKSLLAEPLVDRRRAVNNAIAWFEKSPVDVSSEKDDGGRTPRTLAERITFHAGVSYVRITGNEPAMSKNAINGKVGGPFVRFLTALFKNAGMAGGKPGDTTHHSARYYAQKLLAQKRAARRE